METSAVITTAASHWDGGVMGTMIVGTTLMNAAAVSALTKFSIIQLDLKGFSWWEREPLKAIGTLCLTSSIPISLFTNNWQPRYTSRYRTVWGALLTLVALNYSTLQWSWSLVFDLFYWLWDSLRSSCKFLSETNCWWQRMVLLSFYQTAGGVLSKPQHFCRQRSAERGGLISCKRNRLSSACQKEGVKESVTLCPGEFKHVWKHAS